MIVCSFEDHGRASLRHVTVTGIVLNQKRQIILVKRAKHLINPGKYALPGGFLDRDETTTKCILRETLEETGYTARIVSLFRINDNPNRPKEDRQNVDFVYILDSLDKKQKEDTESTDVSWFDLNAIPDEENMAFDHRETIVLYQKYLKSPFSLPYIG